MASLPTPFQLRPSDLPGSGNPFVLPFNTFVRQVISALGGLTFRQNFSSAVVTVGLPAAATSVTFSHGLKRCTGCLVYNAVDLTTSAGKLIGSVTGDFADNGDGTATVSGMSGLPSNASSVTFLCLSEAI